MLDEALGANWRDEYVVWDCASGTNNLTRDFRFKELYCSTLNQGDVDTVKDMGYNPGSTVFQYDFLNDDDVDVLGPKVPEGLRKAFAEGKKVLFLINPPYGTAGNLQFDKAKKTSIGSGKTNKAMLADNIGGASQQLYAQFLFKISKLNKKFEGTISIGVFANPIFLSGQSFARFRQAFLKDFSFKDGMVFQASNFADVSPLWGIAFTIWNHEETRSDFVVKVKHLNSDTFSVDDIKTKIIYSPTDTAVQWARATDGGIKHEVPNLKSAVSLSDKSKTKMADDALGCFVCDTNIVEKNTSFVTIQSLPPANNNGKFDLIPANFRRCVSLFCARKSIQPDWINCKDEYLVPHASDEDSPLNDAYEQWVNDAVVYDLFNTSSQQSSLRGINYKGRNWDIFNHFFFMPAKEIKELADKAGFQEMYADVKAYGDDRFVYKELESLILSDDAKAVLEVARGIVRQSMGMRKMWHEGHPELHLQAWDAGWAQLKPMFKESLKEDYKAFVELYKAFEERMRKGVYVYGFLK